MYSLRKRKRSVNKKVVFFLFYMKKMVSANKGNDGFGDFCNCMSERYLFLKKILI